jgi:NAD+ synthase (glutamine-hydrolysing)
MTTPASPSGAPSVGSPPWGGASPAAGPVFESLAAQLACFVRDAGVSGVVLGLSGGIDSAVVAALAARALGPEHVWGVGLPGPHSSDHSITDAAALAERLGIRFDVVPIVAAYDAVLATLAGPGAGGLFAGTSFGLAEENLQARLRAVFLMALSNKFGPLLLATGNRSEALVGYATLYGDMAGAVAPIAGCYKTGPAGVYDLARFVNDRAGRDVIPQHTLTKPPSAELAPGQRDDQALPPYEVLDPILVSLADEGRSVEEAAERVGVERSVVESVAARMRRNAFKAHQAAPGLDPSLGLPPS